MYFDITDRIGPLQVRIHEEPEWPMYSYERPAWMLWNAIASGLHQRGWTDDEIKEWLQSKEPRWALDRDLGEAIEKLGHEYATTAQKGC
jgi:hypothetical protein